MTAAFTGSSFETERCMTATGIIPAWFVIEDGDSAASMDIDKSTGPSSALPKSLKLTVDRATAGSRAGLKNTGYSGIPIEANTSY